MSIKISGAQVILAEAAEVADVLVADDGTIAAIGDSSPGDKNIDGRELILAPAMIDIHGDAFERQIMPRDDVFFPLDTALLETDRQLASNGITTAYHALTLSWEPGLRSVEQGQKIIKTLAELDSRLSVDNRFQLRWETFAFEALDLLEQVLESADVGLPSIAFNDHTSMTFRDRSIPIQQRLFEHNPDYRITAHDDPEFLKGLAKTARRTGLSEAEFTDLVMTTWERRPEVVKKIESIAELARSKSVPMLSHDDTQEETRSFYRELGATITEFPMNVNVAEAARKAGDFIVFGAPNVVRGGSHIGSPSAADMVEAGLCDILASDYFYPAMLAAIARLKRENRDALPTLWSLVSRGPARALNLSDRGEIAVGKRADLVLIDWPEAEVPTVRMTMSGGKLSYFAEA